MWDKGGREGKKREQGRGAKEEGRRGEDMRGAGEGRHKWRGYGL